MITLLRREFTVELPLEKAWQHFARVEQWPSWAKHIKQAPEQRRQGRLDRDRVQPVPQLEMGRWLPLADVPLRPSLRGAEPDADQDDVRDCSGRVGQVGHREGLCNGLPQVSGPG